ncbi:MAG: alkylated DNA repair dioxygenase AlkB [Flavobacteriaceae bacterium]|jgi:alkylated DNA repair dioxygenase AlkB|uniref:alpha-ketoglutarate-dependent dioxygenase AlkB family protein n=1 Tax=Candidatus Marifrigoribacter sp. Uisw_064 TaxID=3230970 RepID=UPI003AE7BA12
MNLFSSHEKEIRLDLPQADIVYYPSFFASEKGAEYYNRLLSETEWQQDDITVYGKTFKQPRLTALYGLDEKAYSYSGLTMAPNIFSPLLIELKNEIEKVSEIKFTAVLINLYRNGNDSMGWHSDDEKELGKNPVIASLTLGAERFFHLKHKENKELSYKLLLEHGSLLIMKGETQHFWQHQIPKSKAIQSPRINLTFRQI